MEYIIVYDSCLDQEYITTYQEHCEQVANMQDNGYDFEGCILKQADTIKDLCDEFVLISGRNKKAKPFLVRYHKRNERIEVIFDDYSKRYIDCDDRVFGAIWTGKGLIYVAELNEKGGLELL